VEETEGRNEGERPRQSGNRETGGGETESRGMVSETVGKRQTGGYRGRDRRTKIERRDRE
jgi:hypothetical protein